MTEYFKNALPFLFCNAKKTYIKMYVPKISKISKTIFL